MKVKLGDTWLASSGSEQVSGLRWTQTRQTQVAQYVRAAYATAFPRGNWQHSISFTVTRQHASATDAEVYVAEHPGTLPDQGTLLIEPPNAVSSRWIADAILVQVDLVALIGSTTQWSYSLIGGEVLSEDPDA